MGHTLTPLRYPGGKTKLYPLVSNIIANNQPIDIYAEPFAGGAGLAIKLLLTGDVKKIILNDADKAIYAFWYSILNFHDDFCQRLIETEVTMDEWHHQNEVYACELSKNTSTDLFSLGFATFFLNRTNVSGIIKGGVIGGKKQTGKYKLDCRFNKKMLLSKINKIYENRHSISITNLDALEFIDQYKEKKNIFINFDPPYVKKGPQLYKNSYQHKDHIILGNKIKDCHCKWIVTYDVCDLVLEIYTEYNRDFIDIKYSTGHIKEAKEVLFLGRNTIYSANHNNVNGD